MKAMLTSDQATIQAMFPRQGEPEGDLYTTGLRVVVPDGRSPVRPELFDPSVVEHLELPAFKAWLAKYRLTSS
jgi:ribose transport system substrate-binding protein